MADLVLGAIWAQAGNGVIGRNGDMPWYAPEDLAHFKSVTGSAPVIMGRVTWESIPERFRPLPGRLNIVVSRSMTEPTEAGGALWVPHLHTAVAEAVARAEGDHIWIMGGASIYEQALATGDFTGVAGGRVSLVERTVFEGAVSGDASAPVLISDWTRVGTTDPQTSERGYLMEHDGSKIPLVYSFESWQR